MTATTEASKANQVAGGAAGAAEGAGATAVPTACPRCGADVQGQERFYGPCTSCREALRAAYGGEAREVEVEAYEPKMNVTPNAVALKDD